MNATGNLIRERKSTEISAPTSPSRSKWHHNFGYGNLQDDGLADKKAAIKHLARRHSYIDSSCIGSYGHSGGGFMPTAAMLVYPDFFKVAVSSSGNLEKNIYNRWSSEKHHGVKEVKAKDGNTKFEYTIERNSDLAKNLEGAYCWQPVTWMTTSTPPQPYALPMH